MCAGALNMLGLAEIDTVIPVTALEGDFELSDDD